MKRSGVLKIVSKKQPWYFRLLSAIFFSAAAYLILLFYLNKSFSFSEKYYISGLKILALVIILVAYGIKYSVIISHHFDFDSKRYREYWSVGFFGKGKWKSMQDLDRVSTFLNSKKYCEVNIWDIKNNRYSITAFEEIDDAVIYGRNLAENLEIRFKERK